MAVELTTVKKVTDIRKIPKGVEVISEAEAFHILWDKINKLPIQETWVIRHGAGLLGVLSMAGGLIFNHHYRRQLMMTDIARVTTYLPMCMVPAIMGTFLQHGMITTDMVLQKTPCPVCLEVKSIAIQVATGVLYPLMVGPLVCFPIAKLRYTYPLPEATEFREVFKLWWKITKPALPKTRYLLLANGLGAAGFTYLQGVFLERLQPKLWGNTDDSELLDN